MKRNLIFLILAVVIGAAAGLILYVRYQRNSALVLAQSHLNKGRWEQALKVVEPVYQSNSRDLEAALVVAQARRGLSETEMALSALAPFLPPSREEPGAMALAGWIYLDRGDVQAATDLFTQLGKQPNQKANSLVGLAAAKLLESEGYSERLISEARHEVNLALARAPQSGLAQLVLGEVALAQRNLSEAVSAAGQAIRWLDNPAPAYLLRGRIRLTQRHYPQAQSDFRKALALGAPRPAAKRQLALAQYHLGHVSQALSILKENPQSDTPEGVQTALDLVALYALSGNQPAAINLLVPIAQKSENPVLSLQLYELYESIGEHKNGSRVLRELTRRAPFFTAGLIEEAAKAWGAGNDRTVRTRAIHAYDSNPDNIWAGLLQETLVLLDHNPQRALDYFDAIQDRPEVPPSGRINAALACLMLDRPEEAEDRLSQVPPRLQGDSRFLRALALTRQHLGDLKKALAWVPSMNDPADRWLEAQLLLRAYRFAEAERGLVANPESKPAHFLLLKAILAAVQGRESQAEEYLNQFDLKRAELNPLLTDWAELVRAYCAVRSGDQGTAAKLLSELVRSDSPVNDPARALATRLGETGGGAESASWSTQESGEPRKNSPFFSFETALSLEQSGHNEEAIQRYRTLLSQTPSFPPAVDHLAKLLWSRGNKDAAREQYQILLQLGCGKKIVRRNLAGLAWGKGDMAEAGRLFAQAEKAGAFDENLNLERCLLELRAGRIKKVQQILGPLQQSSNPAVLAARGYLAAAKEDWPAAAALLERAATERPDDSWVWINRGIALVHLARYSEAEQVFQKGVKIAPSLAEGHRLLGQLYASQGLYREAYRSLSTSLRLDPNQPQVAKLVNRIGVWIGATGA